MSGTRPGSYPSHSIGCQCTLQAELDARLMHAFMLLDDDEGNFEFEVHGAGLLQVRSLLEEAGLLRVRSLLEKAAWEAAAAGVGRGRGLQ